MINDNQIYCPPHSSIFVFAPSYINQLKLAPVLYEGKDYTSKIEENEAGIWQGRFQIIHNGHYHVFEESLSKFSVKMVAIVNPNPNVKPCDYENFKEAIDNPFTFFERMLLWKMIADDYNAKHTEKIQVIMFPCWHAQEHLEFEKNEFLPRKRKWIVPFETNADTNNDPQAKKAHNLKNMCEEVYRAPLENENIKNLSGAQRKSFNDVPLSRLHASQVRALLDTDAKSPIEYTYEKCVPECIEKLQKELYQNIRNNRAPFNEIDLSFISIPYIGNQLQPYLLQTAVDMVNSINNAYLVIIISIRVKNVPEKWGEKEMPWWFQSPNHQDNKHNISYFEKAKMLIALMDKLNFNRYLITPLFVKNSSFDVLREYNEAFLPPHDKNSWILSENDDYSYGFREYLQNLGDLNIISVKNNDLCESIKSFFDNSKFKNFLMKSETIIPIDQTTLNMIEARIIDIFERLTKLAGQPSPPENVSQYLDIIREIQNKKQEYRTIQEFKQVQETLDSISNWLNAIEGL